MANAALDGFMGEFVPADSAPMDPLAPPATRPLARPQSSPQGDSKRSSARALLVLIALCGSCAALAACGAGQSAPSVNAGPAGTTAPGSKPIGAGAAAGSKRRPSRAQALAFARAVNLSAGDLPEASIAPKEKHTDSARERREYRACEKNLKHGHKLAVASSPKLKRGHELEVEQISSSVTVLSDERTISEEVAELKRPGLLECEAHALTRNFSERAIRDARWGRFKVSNLAVRLPGAAETIGIRIAASLDLTYSEVSVPIYVDLLGFGTGPAEIGLTTTSVTQPMPAATEQELLALLLARAKSDPL
jgi:hypothetical protein